jgi:hypothetical protein
VYRKNVMPPSADESEVLAAGRAMSLGKESLSFLGDTLTSGDTEPTGCVQSANSQYRSKRERLFDVAVEIQSTPPSGDELLFSHAIFCQLGLPHSEVKGDTFERQCGSAWLAIQAGYADIPGKGPVRQPIPYGATPRLVMAYLTTFAIRYDTPEIPIGNNPTQFLKLLGVEKFGERVKNLRKQMPALAASRMQMGHCGRTVNGQAFDEFDAWPAEQDREQLPSWPRVITLNEKFLRDLKDNRAVPLDQRAIAALSGSALELDIYTWLAHRLCRIESGSTEITWMSLVAQFGSERKSKRLVHDFQKDFKPALYNVLKVYPTAKVEVLGSGLKLISSAPPVPKLPSAN